MLSVIIYARNDIHGYNYHKRLAISVNCIAEMLTNPNDEIICSDYNTSDELPTLLESISDTLTEKARHVLRILRIRTTLHKLYAKKNALNLLESIARNAAIVRSNPLNKWILSTNPDMIFVPQNCQESLTKIVSELEDGFYLLPRYELPEYLWESALQRSLPNENIGFLRNYGKKLHLQTAVHKNPYLKFDNPGDFQLMLRKKALEFRGFDETMQHGWHVDANLCKRMFLAKEKILSLQPNILAFHCNHTPKEMPATLKKQTENDWNVFINNDNLNPTCNNENWGLSNEVIEEIRLPIPFASNHIKALISTLENSPETEYQVHVNIDSFNNFSYSSARILSYLTDHFCNLPINSTIIYYGYNEILIELLKSYFKKIHFVGKFIHSNTAAIKNSPNDANILIFDFGFDITCDLSHKIKKAKIKTLMKIFCQITKKFTPGTLCIGINTAQTDLRAIFPKYVLLRNSSNTTGISYGYLGTKNSVQLLKRKKRVTYILHYILARYFFSYTDLIRNTLKANKNLKHFINL